MHGKVGAPRAPPAKHLPTLQLQLRLAATAPNGRCCCCRPEPAGGRPRLSLLPPAPACPPRPRCRPRRRRDQSPTAGHQRRRHRHRPHPLLPHPWLPPQPPAPPPGPAAPGMLQGPPRRHRSRPPAAMRGPSGAARTASSGPRSCCTAAGAPGVGLGSRCVCADVVEGGVGPLDGRVCSGWMRRR